MQVSEATDERVCPRGWLLIQDEGPASVIVSLWHLKGGEEIEREISSIIKEAVLNFIFYFWEEINCEMRHIATGN